MKKIINILISGILILSFVSSCKKQDENSARLAKLVAELNESPDKELSNGTILEGCEYNEGDSVFTYVIKVSDNRYDKLDTDSIKRNFSKTVKSPGMTKVLNLLNKANVGLRYKLTLSEKEVLIDFPHSEIAEISKNTFK